MRRRTRFVAALLVLVGIVVGSAASASGAKPTGAASRDTSPVDLATPVDMEAGMAHGSAIVHVGDVRVEVLTPSLLRLEYSPSQHFENSPTVNALNRRMPVPPYSVSTVGGLADRAHGQRHPALQAGVGTVHPAQHLAPPVGRRSDIDGGADVGMGVHLRAGLPGRRRHAEPEAPPSARLSPGTRAPRATRGSSSKPGASVTWHVLGSTPGPAVVSLRYYNLASPPLAPAPSTLDLLVNGQLAAGSSTPLPRPRPNPGRPSPPPCRSYSGTNSIKVVSTTPNSFDLGIDTLAVGPAGSPPPVAGVDRTARRVVPGVRHRHLQRHADLRARPVRCHVPGRHPAPEHRRAAGHGRLAPARRHPERRVDGQRMGATPPRTGRHRGRIPLRVRTRLRRRTAHLGAAHRSGAPPAPGRLRCVVLRLHALFEWRHREFGLPRVRLEQGPPQHAVARHRLEGAQRLERLGMGQLPLPRSLVLSQLGALPRHRRDA